MQQKNISEVVAVALDNLAGGHVDGEECPLGGVRVGQGPDGDLGGVAVAAAGVGVDEAQVAGADPDIAELVEQAPGLPALEHAAPGERDEAEHGVVGEGVSGDDAPRVVGPPEPAEVCERAERRQRARRERVAHALVDPGAGVGVVAAEVGAERLVLDRLPGAQVREAERGARGGVQDEVARVRFHPAERPAVGALDAGERGVEDGGEEEQPRGVRGEHEGEVLRRGAVREHPRGDGQARGARGRGERQGHVGLAAALRDARDAAEDDPRRRRRRGGAGGGVCGGAVAPRWEEEGFGRASGEWRRSGERTFSDGGGGGGEGFAGASAGGSGKPAPASHGELLGTAVLGFGPVLVPTPP
ncbi:hypothetical protein PVAP13_6KG340900 [Panicum virgatum]|uniref:Uncharacterized protein n=1 Tax=Panicum virgatum TaxID=38727 RepID=A0A8T0RIY1_PANVG|nr:hypothetical protein PVAP13_6KG340900 [Panicum virgatum]